MTPTQSLRAMVRGVLLITAAGAAALGLSACSGGSAKISTAALPAPPARSATAAPLKVALILPLTGNRAAAPLAKAMRQAAELALFDANRPELQLIVKDSRGSEAGARAAAEDAVKGGATVILGPLMASSTRAVAPIAERASIPVVSFSNDSGAAGQGVQLLSFLPEDEVRRLVSHAVGTGRRRFAAFVSAGAYGRAVEAVLRSEVRRHGVALAVLERHGETRQSIDQAAHRLATALERMGAGGETADVLLLAGPAETTAMLADAILRAGVDRERMQVMATSGWDASPATARVLAGAWLAAPEPGRWEQFADKFRRATGARPPRLAGLAYDAMTLAARMEPGHVSPRTRLAALTKAPPIDGVDGPILVHADGRIERVLAIVAPGPRGLRVVVSAASSRARGPDDSVPVKRTANLSQW